MKERVTLTKKEQSRLMVLNAVEVGRIIGREAAELLGLSLRHVRRILAAYRKEGAAALAHGNRGRQPHNALDDELKKRVLDLAQSIYAGCNTQHFTELLTEREGITVSRSAVRLILLRAGLRSPRKRRPPKHRSRRERYPGEGMLLQIDASRDDWLETRGPYLSLIGAIDDATGKVPYALFRDEEDAQGYTLLLRHIVENEGIPEALYHDGHGIFERSRRDPESLEEQLAGRRKPTQFGQMMEELGIIWRQATDQDLQTHGQPRCCGPLSGGSARQSQDPYQYPHQRRPHALFPASGCLRLGDFSFKRTGCSRSNRGQVNLPANTHAVPEVPVCG